MKPSGKKNLLKFQLLQKLDHYNAWNSLDDERHCILCGLTISGYQITVKWDRLGIARLACPTRRCRATPAHWVHPGNPLVSEEAWQDWVRLLNTLTHEAPEQRIQRFLPAGPTVEALHHPSEKRRLRRSGSTGLSR